MKLILDLSGGMMLLPELNEIMKDLRADIIEKSEIKTALKSEELLDQECAEGLKEEPVVSQRRANNTFEFPTLLSFEELQKKVQMESLRKEKEFSLSNMIDLEKTSVIVGFAEVGPWGGSRTRWEIESAGKLSIKGCLELARIMGYVKFFNGRLKSGKAYIGWVEIDGLVPISDEQVKTKYESKILEHTGIRFIGTIILIQNRSYSEVMTLKRRISAKKLF